MIFKKSLKCRETYFMVQHVAFSVDVSCVLEKNMYFAVGLNVKKID